MKQKLNLKAVLTAVVFLITIFSQFIPIAQANAASLTSPNGSEIEFFTGRSNICNPNPPPATPVCDALTQWGLNPCVYEAANKKQFFGSGYNGGYVGFKAATANNNLPTGAAYTLLEDLLAYYYGVDAGNSCAGKVTVINYNLSPSSIGPLDNIGASFDILSILKGNSVPGGYFTYNNSYVTFNTTNDPVISPFTDLITKYFNAGQVCQQQKMIDTYNTAMDISSGSFDVGRATNDLRSDPRTMVGLLQAKYSHKCGVNGNLPQSDFIDLVDEKCGNISMLPAVPPQILCTSFSCKSSCSITSSYDGQSPKQGTLVTFYLNWNLPNPETTRINSAQINSNQSGANVAPMNVRIGGPPGTLGYNTTNDPLTDSPVSSSSAYSTITYLGYMNVKISGSDTKIVCTPDTINWSIINHSCVPPGQAQEAAQKNVYDPAYNNWYQYDQVSVGAPLGGYQKYKTATDQAASSLSIPLQTYLNDVNVYYALLNSEPQPPAYNPPAYNPPIYNFPVVYNPPAYNPPAYNPPPPPSASFYYDIAGWLNYFQQLNNYYTSYNQQLANYNTSYNQQLANYNTSYYQQLSSYNNSYNQQLANYNTSYNQQMVAYNNWYNSAYNNYVIAHNNWKTNLQIALNNAFAAYNAMQPYYQAWVSLSEQTYNSTTLYYDNGPAPYYFYSNVSINNNSYYNQDLNRYNSTVAALNTWKAAYQKQATACDAQPYFTVSGGDIIAGSGSANSNGSCSSNSSANIFASNVGGPSWIGASDNLSALAPSIINGLSTGGGGDALTFANSVNGPYGGNFGSANGVCNLDYYSTKNNLVGFSVYPTSGSFDLSTATSSPACKLIDTTNYCSLNGPVNISGNPPTGSKVVVYVKGRAEISSDINIYNNSPSLNSAADIPLLYVISSTDIYIDSTAKTIDGVYSAANGTIFTCANAGNSFSGNQADQALISGCNNQLTVNGSLVANQIKFGRVYGGLPGQYGSVGAAETFNYGPEIWLSQIQGSMPINPDYQDLTELSPVI